MFVPRNIYILVVQANVFSFDFGNSPMSWMRDVRLSVGRKVRFVFHLWTGKKSLRSEPWRHAGLFADHCLP